MICAHTTKLKILDIIWDAEYRIVYNLITEPSLPQDDILGHHYTEPAISTAPVNST